MGQNVVGCGLYLSQIPLLTYLDAVAFRLVAPLWSANATASALLRRYWPGNLSADVSSAVAPLPILTSPHPGGAGAAAVGSYAVGVAVSPACFLSAVADGRSAVAVDAADDVTC